MLKFLPLLLLALLGAPGRLPAQAIRFERDSLAQVFARARQQHKPVFVLLAAPPAPADLPPELRAARRASGLRAPAVATQLNQEFLSKELAFGTRESAALVRQYTVTSYPTYLYFHPDGSLLHRSFGNAATAERYLRDLTAARQALTDPQNLSFFQDEFAKGNRAADLLRRYLAKRRELGQLVEPALLDAYVRELPVKAFDQDAEVVFILDYGPVVGSTAYQLTHLRPAHTDSIYLTLPPAQRVRINNAIIGNTMTRAIQTKDRSLAMLGADFARRSWSRNYARGARSYDTNLLNFYRSTNDTASYLRQAVSFYDRYYMSISADSAQRAVAALRAFRQEQALSRQRLLQVRRQAAAGNAAAPAAGPTPLTSVQRVAISSAAGPPGSFLLELNNAAWAIYQTGTRNEHYLLQALRWSRRTVDLDPAFYNYDTLAHLLYRLRFYREAEATQAQAVAAARQEKTPSLKALEQELRKMQQRTL